MKKLLLTSLALLAFGFVSAQDGATSKGKILVEANTGNAMLGTTGIYFSSQDGNSNYSIGLDGGYFIMDDLAIKVGLGLNGFSNDANSGSAISYRLGGKYYINSMIPVSLDLTGASGKDVWGDEAPMWLGVGAGYAWFIGSNVAIEPGLRYNHSLNDNFTDKGVFQVNIGFTLFF